MSGQGNSGFAAEQLRSLVERIERLDEEAKALNEDRRDIYAEAKANGFDTKVMRKIIGDRRKDPAERQEFDAIYDLYAHALGMAPGSEPLAPAPARAREEETESGGFEPARITESGENSADEISPSSNSEKTASEEKGGEAVLDETASAPPLAEASPERNEQGEEANVTKDITQQQTKAGRDTPPVPPGSPTQDPVAVPNFLKREKAGGASAHK